MLHQLIPCKLSAFSLCALASVSVVADNAFDYAAGEVQYSKMTLPSIADTVGYVLSTDLDGDGDFDVILTGSTYPSAGGASRGGQQGRILFNTGSNVFVEAEGAVFMRNLEFEVIDAGKLQFRLQTYE